MSRRIALPGADELFRSTGDPGRAALAAPEEAAHRTEPARAGSGLALAPTASAPAQPEARFQDDDLELDTPSARAVTRRRPRSPADRRPSGRERHEEKITVYVSAEELMDLEHARLTLRGDFGLTADRGRVVREALAVVLADLEAKGEASILVRRLRGR